jgi:hypothetical protein
VLLSVKRLGCQLDNEGSFPGMGNNRMFSLHRCIQTSSGTHLASYPKGTKGSDLGDGG